MPTVTEVSELPYADFLKILEGEQIEHHWRYLLQTAIGYCDSGDVRKVVLELIISGKATIRTIFEVLIILNANLPFVNDSAAKTFCDFLLTHFIQSRKYGPELLNVITHFAAWRPNLTASCFLTDPSRFIVILSELDPLYMETFISFSPLFGNKNILLSFRNDQPRLVGYFQLVSGIFDESCDIDSSMKFCLSLLKDPDSPLFINVCRLFDSLCCTKDQEPLFRLLTVLRNFVGNCLKTFR
jgi:hypothetical protein